MVKKSTESTYARKKKKMIMTHTEETSTTFQSETPGKQMNGHAMTGGESRVTEEPGSSRSLPSEGRHTDGTSGSSVLEMGSTDSAGSSHGGVSSCGLVSSLFPSSCRGRAEAFARRLHHRLTSLGGDDSSTDHDSQSSSPKETSWLHAGSGTKSVTLNNSGTHHVLQRQPRHSQENELYYDFDPELEDEGTSSPQEEATAAELADLLVNPGVLKTNHCNVCSENGSSIVPNQENEKGYIFASPITGTSPESEASEMYFDPESSDPEKSKNEVYFDPITTSESETTSNLSNGCTVQKKRNLPPRRSLMNNVDGTEDTSESSLSSRRNDCDKQRYRNDVVVSSEDSFNGKSSSETTSASDESLWSTFDESTMSLQDDSPSRINGNAIALENHLPKSHSDSEIPVNGTRAINALGISNNSDKIDQGIDEVDFIVMSSSTNGDLSEASKTALNYTKESSSAYLEDEVADFPLDDDRPSESTTQNVISLKVEDISTADNNHTNYCSTLNIPGALTIECSLEEQIVETTVKNEVEIEIENGTVMNGTDEEKMCILLQKLATSPTVKEDAPVPGQVAEASAMEDEEEETEGRPPKIRRCSSLKTGKTPPGTPGRKKIVRFADVLGLDLADVRTFLDEIPKIPNSAYSDLVYDEIFQKDSSPVNSLSNSWGTTFQSRYLDSRRGSGSTAGRKLEKTLVPLFQQPGGLPNFLDLVRERRVCLENAIVEDPLSLSIRGTVRVLNLDFHKSVHIRYTLNSWRNFSDLQASYVINSCDGFSDKFSFVLYCHTLQVGQRLEFAVRFQCKGTQYWDNNSGINYCFQCLPGSPTAGYIPITAATTRHQDWSPVFY